MGTDGYKPYGVIVRYRTVSRTGLGGLGGPWPHPHTVRTVSVLRAVRFAVVGGLVLLLAGCASSATYRHADGRQVTCRRAVHYPGAGLLGLLTSPLYAVSEYEAARDYGACKEAAERLGFERQR